MEIQNATPVGRIAAEHPLATRVFARHGIGTREDDVHQHIHLENNILFPRALTM